LYSLLLRCGGWGRSVPMSADIIRAFNARAEAAGWPTNCDPALDFESPLLREALALWREKAGARRWPSRADLTPRLMKGFLTNVAIVDVVRAEGKLRFRTRVTGSEIEYYYGSAPIGTFLDDAVPEPFRERWSAGWGLALDVEGPVRTTGRLEFRKQEYLNTENLVAPLGETLPDAVLQVSVFQPAPGVVSLR
jgi:hypothetical protein